MYVADASVWVARFWRNDPLHSRAYEWLESLTFSATPIFAPTILLAEMGGSLARRVGRTRAGLDAVGDIEEMANAEKVRLVQLNREMVGQSANVAARLRLRGMDAIYVATAQHTNSTLVTLDNEQRERAASVVSAIALPNQP